MMGKYILIPIFLFLAVFFISEYSNGSGVLCEYLTSTTCHACPPVAESLEEIYNSHEYPFYFVSMVSDKNQGAEERSNYYNVVGYPTAVFNGGYRVIFGKHDKGDYINAIKDCMKRNSKISIKVESRWVKDGLSIYANITNDYASYNGKIRIYIVEKISEWRDYDGNNFRNAFIDYAMNKEISISKGKKVYHTVWQGNMDENIMVIAAIFNSEENTAYSDPPYNTHEFTAHFVDAVASSMPKMDLPPEIRFLNKPDKISGYANISFKWEGSDDGGSIEYSYKLDGYEDWSEWSNITHVTYELTDGNYKFMVRARDNMGQITQMHYSFKIDTSPPHVVYTYPSDNALNFRPYENIIIKFSHPMKKNIIIKFNPSVSYNLKWVNEYECHISADSMEYGKKYTLTVIGERKSGQKMEKPYVISFETSPRDTSRPYVEDVSPYYEEYYDGIRIKFSKPMDTFIFRGIEITPYVPYTHSWKENDTLLLINFIYLLPNSYKVNINEYIQDKYGNKLKENASFEFFITRPHIVYNSAENKTIGMHDAIEIKFSHPMNKTSVENGIKIIPPSAYSIEWIDEKRLRINGNWSEDEYIVSIKGARDIRNLTMKDYKFYFRTWYPFYEVHTRNTPSFTLIMAILSIILLLFRRRK